MPIATSHFAVSIGKLSFAHKAISVVTRAVAICLFILALVIPRTSLAQITNSGPPWYNPQAPYPFQLSTALPYCNAWKEDWVTVYQGTATSCRLRNLDNTYSIATDMVPRGTYTYAFIRTNIGPQNFLAAISWPIGFGYDAFKNLGSGDPCSCGEGIVGGESGAVDGPSGTSVNHVGDPIDASTGIEYLQEDDYDGSSWLTFRRFYNSMTGLTGTAMGSNWRNSFDRQLIYSGSSATPVEITIIRPDGRHEMFIKTNGSWGADPGISDTLTETDDANGNPIQFVVYISSLHHYEYYAAVNDADGTIIGQLQSVKDESGQGIALTYSTNLTDPTVAPSVGLLLSVSDPLGRQLNFLYDSQGFLKKVTLPDGGSLNYAYDEVANNSNTYGNLTSVEYPDSSTRQYLYSETSYTAGNADPGLLTGVVDENGVRYETISYTTGYLTNVAVSSSFAGNVGTTQVAYSTSGNATVTYPLGAASTLGFTPLSGINKITANSAYCGPDCGQQFASRTYDANGNLSTSKDFNGNLTKTFYTLNGLLTQEIDASGSPTQRTTNFTWSSPFNAPLTRTVSNAVGALISNTQWVYNSNGQILARCDIDPTNGADSGYSCSGSGVAPNGVRRWTYTYCTNVDAVQCPLVGLMLTVTGPRTDITQTTSNSYYMSSSAVNCGTPGAACYRLGDLHTVTDSLGHVTTIASYDADGRITRITDANGINTDMTYTARGWLASRNVGGALTKFTYTAYGALQTITDPDGVITTYGYDTAHRLNKITDAMGNYIQYTLDAAGNNTGEQVYDAGGILRNQVSTTFNTLGQLTTVVDGLGNTVFNAGTSGSYDSNGNLIRESDALGIQRKLGYDALNRLVQTVDNYNGTDPSTQNTKVAYQYDSLDRLIQVTDPSNLNTTYSYDGLDNILGRQSPDTGATSRTFDAAGNVLTLTDAKGITATNTYDALDRLVSTTYPHSAQNVVYYYDEPNSTTNCNASYPIGHLTRIIESSVTTIYCYDARGNVIEKQQVLNGVTDLTGYEISQAGRLTGLVYPSGTLVSYARDTDAHILSVTVTPPNGVPDVTVSNVTYLPFGPVSGYTLSNGQQIARTFNANYRLTDLTSPTFSLHLARDAMGDITAIGNAPGANPATETYGYDPLYRLITVAEANGETLESLTYNQNGDRISKSGSGLATGAYSYNTGTHQLIATGNAARTVDADGNTTAISQGGNTYGFGFSDRNRVSVAQLGGATIASYIYNALNQRIQKIAGGLTERYDYSEGSQLLAEYGATTRDYIWMDDIPVANVDTSGKTGTLVYVIADQLGTPREITDASGNTEWKNAYQGNLWNEQAPTSNGYLYNLGFPGQYFDKETGMFYNYHRDYDPSSGRYIESDPIGLLNGPSTYAYVVNSPLVGTDSLGLACNARGCWNTSDELASADIGDYAGYYAKACAGGDPYACRAGEVATDTGHGLRGMLSEITNRKLEWSIAGYQPYCPQQFLQDDMRRKMQNIRNDLMKARINQLRNATPDNPLQVNKQDISAFHHSVFDQNGAGPDAFGGDLWDKTGLQGPTNYNWCEFPSCKP